jgi:hypothetical protein
MSVMLTEMQSGETSYIAVIARSQRVARMRAR